MPIPPSPAGPPVQRSPAPTPILAPPPPPPPPSAPAPAAPAAPPAGEQPKTIKSYLPLIIALNIVLVGAAVVILYFVLKRK
ncbi:MAG: hypothetical protein ABJF01_00725 [bacterium]